MSFTFNGIGTHLYGKENLAKRQDQCEQCGKASILNSYDTTNFFVVLFIPLIPIGKFRILDHCPHCQRWKQLKLKDWNAQKEKALRASLDRLKQDHQNPDAVKQAIATATQFQDESILLKFKDLAAGMTHDAEVQQLFSAALSYFGKHQDAIGPLKHALAATDTREIREQLAYELLQTGKPDEAEQYVDYVWTDPDPNLLPLARAIAECYQATSNHDAAIERIGRMEATHPVLSKNKEFVAFRKQAEKYRQKNTVIKTNFDRPDPVEPSAKSFNIAKLIGPAIVVLLVLGYLGVAFIKGNARDVFVVNGLTVGYTAVIDEQEIQLNPGARKQVTIKEGEHTISGKGADFEIPEQTARVVTPFFSRPFSDYTFVINPDQAAIIEFSEIVYSEDLRNANEGIYECISGQLCFSKSGVDYPFTNPPRQIEVSDTSRDHRREFLAIISPDQAAYFLEPERLAEFCKAQLKYGSQSFALIYQLSAIVDPDDFVEFARPFLERRPLAIEWHRAYQEVIERSKPSFDVVGEYKTLSDAEPADSGLLYLLARVTPNQSDKSRILDQAIEVSKSVSPYALYGKGYEFISKGEFDQALPYVERAVRAEPSNISFTTAYQTCLAAMGRWSEAIEKISKAHDDDSPISQTQKLTSTLPLMIAAGRRDEAEAKILQLVNGLEMPTESKQQWKAGLEDLLQYAAGDLNLIYSRYEEDELDLRFWMLVSQNKLDEATKMMAEADSVEDPNSYISHLLLYVRGHDANRADIADKHLKLAIARLETGDADERLLAGLLAAPELPGAETYVPTAWPSQSRTVALALSRRIPEKKAEYEALANRLNFERTFPYWFIKESIE